MDASRNRDLAFAVNRDGAHQHRSRREENSCATSVPEYRLRLH